MKINIVLYLLLLFFCVFLHGCSPSRRISYDEISQTNLKQIGLAITLYAQDHGNHIPPMHDATLLEAALAPYIEKNNLSGSSVFVQPETKHHYSVNKWLSGKSIADIYKSNPNAARDILLYEDQAAPNGTVAFLELDGRVYRVPNSEWNNMKKGLEVSSKGVS